MFPAGFVGRNDVVVYSFIELLDNVEPADLRTISEPRVGHKVTVPSIQRQLRVEHAAFYRKLLQEQFDAVPPINIVYKYQAFALDEFELEDDVGEKELVNFGAPVCRLGCVNI